MRLAGCLVFVCLLACSRPEPIVFVPWPGSTRYAWDTDAMRHRDVWDEALVRVGAAREIARLQAMVPGADFEADVRVDEAVVEASGPGAVGDAVGGVARVELNTATLTELDRLPRIGPALAQRIIDARPFRRVEDLRRVSGIGESTFAGLRDRVFVASPADGN